MDFSHGPSRAGSGSGIAKGNPSGSLPIASRRSSSSDPTETLILPTEVRERFGSFRELSSEGNDVAIVYTLHGPNDALVLVREQIEPKADGWERQVTVTGVPDGFRPACSSIPRRESRPGMSVRIEPRYALPIPKALLTPKSPKIPTPVLFS